MASERSERDTLRGNAIEISLYLASERSERDTYRGKNEIIGDVCLLASERSERDSIRGGQCKIGYMLYIYIYVCMYGWYVCSLNARASNYVS